MRRAPVWISGGVLLYVLCTIAAAQTAQKSKESASLRQQYNAALQEMTRLKQEFESARRDLVPVHFRF